MNEGLIPNRYAKALYKYAREHGVAEAIYEEMKRFDDAFKTHPEFSKILGNPALSPSDMYGCCHRLSVKSPTTTCSVLFS